MSQAELGREPDNICMQQQRKISRNHVPTTIVFPVETFISPTPLPRSTLRGSARVAGFIEPIQHLPSPSHLSLTISLSLASRSFSMPYLACRHSDSDIVHKKAGRQAGVICSLIERAAIHNARCSRIANASSIMNARNPHRAYFFIKLEPRL